MSTVFFFTGLAIIVYLNQYPFQPRERDYAYAGSFYAFTIWIGLGVLGLIDALTSKIVCMGLILSINWPLTHLASEFRILYSLLSFHVRYMSFANNFVVTWFFHYRTVSGFVKSKCAPKLSQNGARSDWFLCSSWINNERHSLKYGCVVSTAGLIFANIFIPASWKRLATIN